MFTCKLCGAQAEDNVNFCPKCGANLKQNGVYTDSQPSANENVAPAAPVAPAAAPAAPAAAPVAPAAPAAPVTPAAAPEKKEKKGNKGLIIAIAAILVVAIGVGAFFLFGGMKGGDASLGNAEEAPAEDEVVITNEAVKAIAEEDLTTLALYPDREVTKADLEDFAALIDERAKVLGDTYQITVEDDRIILVIEKDILGETAVERTSTVEMLVSRGNIHVGSGEYASYDVENGQFKKPEIEELDRVDILRDYRSNLVDSRYAQLDSIKGDTLYAVKVKTGNDVAEDIERVIDYDKSNYKATLTHDFDSDAYSSENVHFLASMLIEDEDDTSEVYVVTPGASYDKNAELLLLLLTQDEMEFGLVMDILDDPNWEVEGKRMGDNQLTEMSGETIVAKCAPDKYTRTYNSDVDFAEYESAVKSRLDNLNIEYMFGTTGFDDKTYCVKVHPSDISPEFFRLIFGSRSITVRSAFDDVNIFYTPVIVEKDGKLALRLETYYDPTEIASKYTIANNILYFVANDVTIASADVTKLTKGDRYYYLDFENFLCFDSPTATESERAVLETICALGDEGYISFDGTFQFATDGDDKTSLDDFAWKYTAMTANDNVVFDKVRNMGYEIEKDVESRSTIVITIDEEVDDDLPKDFMKKIEEIYTACNFDDGAYSKITFVIKDEKKESPANQFRFEVTKDTYDGEMEINDRVGGPKFSEYWMEVYDKMEAEGFFKDHSWRNF